jgi:hypothetical protein
MTTSSYFQRAKSMSFYDPNESPPSFDINRLFHCLQHRKKFMSEYSEDSQEEIENQNDSFNCYSMPSVLLNQKLIFQTKDGVVHLALPDGQATGQNAKRYKVEISQKFEPTSENGLLILGSDAIVLKQGYDKILILNPNDLSVIDKFKFLFSRMSICDINHESMLLKSTDDVLVVYNPRLDFLERFVFLAFV